MYIGILNFTSGFRTLRLRLKLRCLQRLQSQLFNNSGKLRALIANESFEHLPSVTPFMTTRDSRQQTAEMIK